MATIDLTPKYPLIPMKEKVTLLDDIEVFGQTLGGMTANATSVQQGSGNEIYKFDYRGLWLGAADFDDAPFSVSMAGAITGTGLTVSRLDIPNTTSAQSMHVDLVGNTWWGDTALETAKASVLNTGVGTFSDITITGGSISVVAGGNTIGFTPDGGNAIFSGTTGNPEFAVTPTGVLTATGAIVNGSILAGQDIFGDGDDGVVTISSNTTLTRDWFYDDLTIDDTFTLNTNGYRIFVKGTCSVTGTIENTGGAGGNGGIGGNGTTGSGGSAGSAGAAGAAASGGTLKASLAGTIGIVGAQGGNNANGDTGGVGNNGNALAAGGLVGAGVNGVSGATGGACQTKNGGTGGAGGTGGTFTSAISRPRTTPMSTLFGYFDSSGTFVQFDSSGGSASGGSGGGGGGDTNVGGGGAGGGGGTGGNGGITLIAAKTITVNAGGKIRSNGGTGGAGGNGGDAGGTGASGGGGAGGTAGNGGNGGIVILLYSTHTNAGTIEAEGVAGTGGNGGAGFGGGGFVGGTGTNGAAGNAGQVITLQV